MFCEKQQIYHGNKSHLLTTFNPTPYLRQLLRRMHQFWIFQRFWIFRQLLPLLKLSKNLQMELLDLFTIYLVDYSHIDMVIDSYFDSSLKPNTLEPRGYGQFFPFTEKTNGLAG